MPLISGGGSFTGGTIHETTIVPRTAAGVGLAVMPPSGATAAATDEIEVYDDSGHLIFFVDAAGNVFGVSSSGAGGNLDYTDGSGGRLRVTGGSLIAAPADGHSFKVNGTSNVAIIDVSRNAGGDGVGLFGATPASQQALTPGTATPEQIATVLQTYGLSHA